MLDNVKTGAKKYFGDIMDEIRDTLHEKGKQQTVNTYNNNTRYLRFKKNESNRGRYITITQDAQMMTSKLFSSSTSGNLGLAMDPTDLQLQKEFRQEEKPGQTSKHSALLDLPQLPTPQITGSDVVDGEEDQDQDEDQDTESQGLIKKKEKDKEQSDTGHSLSNTKSNSKSMNGKENEKSDNTDHEDSEMIAV